MYNEPNLTLWQSRTHDHYATPPEGSFLNGFSRLREKLAPTPVLDLAFLAPTRELGPMEVLKNCPLGVTNYELP
jgi:hypothetical protein